MTRWFFLAASLGLATPALAIAVVATSDRVEIDYSAQKLRFYGEATVKPEEGPDAMKAAEKRARLEGLDYLAKSGEKALPFKPAELRASTASYVTNYYADGTVRVYLETSLADVAPRDMAFAQKEKVDATAAGNSGVVFVVDKKAKPAALYQIVDEAGTVLFEAKDMAEAAFHQGLMGRWLQRPSEHDLSAAVGAKPAHLALVTVSPGKFLASRAAWDEVMKDSRPLLVNGQVALLVP